MREAEILRDPFTRHRGVVSGGRISNARPPSALSRCTRIERVLHLALGAGHSGARAGLLSIVVEGGWRSNVYGDAASRLRRLVAAEHPLADFVGIAGED